MTILQHQLTNESSGTGTPFVNQQAVVARSSYSNVFLVEVKPVPLPVKNSLSIDDFVKDIEADPDVAKALSSSRQRFAKAAYSNKPQTLTSLRLSAGLSQDQLAQNSGTSQSHIAKIEAGKNDPSTDMIQKIAVALALDPALVFNAISNQRNA